MRIKKLLQQAILFSLLLIVIIIVAIGCQPSSEVVQISSDPFSVTFGLGEGDTQFALSGNSAGHVAGKSSKFELLLNNKSAENKWKGEYYIVLVDSENIILEITQDSF